MMSNRTMEFMLPYDSWHLRVLAEYAAKIASLNFEWRYVTLVLFIESTGLGVSDFIRAYGNTVGVSCEQSLAWIARAHLTQFVLYGKTLAEIGQILRLLSKYNMDNTGRFLVVCTDPHCDESEVMKQCWNRRIVNVVFVRSAERIGVCKCFTYFPFGPGHCEDTRPHLLMKTDVSANDYCFKGMYPEKLSNLHKCPIIASTFKQPPFVYIENGTKVSGSDGDLLLLLAKLLNASLEVVTAPHGEGWGHFENLEWTGSLGDVYKRKANFSMTSAALTYQRYVHFHISVPYNSLDIVWVTSPSPPKPGWEKLVYPYTFGVRIVLFGTFALVAVLHYLTKTQKWNKIRKVLKIDFFKRNLLFWSWFLFMGMPVDRTPLKPAIAVIFIFWVIFSFLIRAGYQAVLISSLEMNRYAENYKTFEEVSLNNKIPFGGVSSLKEYFRDERWIHKGWKDLQAGEINSTLLKMASAELEFTMAVNIEIVLEILKSHNGKSRLQILPLKIVNSPTVIYFKKYSPLASPINHLLSVAMEGGFSQRLYGSYAPARNVLKEALSSGVNSKNEKEPRSLTFYNFTGCWTLITVGWTISALSFIVEMFCRHRRNFRGK